MAAGIAGALRVALGVRAFGLLRQVLLDEACLLAGPGVEAVSYDCDLRVRQPPE
jgi:hypothetical protein